MQVKRVIISGLYKAIVASHLKSVVAPWATIDTPLNAPSIDLGTVDADVLDSALDSISPWDKSLSVRDWAVRNGTTITITNG